MKALKIIFFSVIALIVLTVLGIFIFVKTFNVNKYLPQITQQAGQAINRKVNIDHANLTLDLRGLSLALKGITIIDDPQFGPNNFLSLSTADVGLDVAALLRRQLNITRIILDHLKISIIRSANGTINAQTLAAAASGPAASPIAANASSKPQANPAMALPAIFVKSLVVKHVQLSFEDQNPQAPLNLAVSDGDININDFSLNGPFDFTINLNVAAKTGNNIAMTGHCALDAAKSAVHVTDIHIKSDLNQWDWEKVKAITPALASLPVASQIKGDLALDIPQLNVSSTGLQNLSVSLQMHAGSGEINAQVTVHGISTSPIYDFHITSKSVKIEELLDQSKTPAQIEGELNADFSGTGQSFEPQSMLTNLKGEGNTSLNNGKIEKLNILKTILGKLDFIPGLGGILQNAIETSLPSNIKSELDTDTTELTKAEGKIKVENKTINLEDAQLESKLFSINAQGTVDFDLNTNINVKTYLASDLSGALTQKAKPLQSLLDEQNRLYLPGSVSGKAPSSIAYHLQTDYVTKKVTVFEGSQQLQKVFSKNPQIGNILNTLLGTPQN
jgi:uncharacterized protein involved in outer membrane biogenesis